MDETVFLPIAKNLHLLFPFNWDTYGHLFIITESGQGRGVKGNTFWNSYPDHIKLFCHVPTVNLLGIMLRNRCWSTIFHTITTKDADK